MIINDPDIVCIMAAESKNDTELIVDTNAIFSS